MSVHPRRLQWFFLTKVMYVFVVSIHAPTKGATSSSPPPYARRSSFNPRTHEGCDSCYHTLALAPSCFNPRTHEGCDTCTPSYRVPCRGFNPRTHEGCDHKLVGTKIRTNMFQSTHPRRVRLFVSSFLIVFLRFQSTHPRRVRRAQVGCVHFVLVVSIHAPTKGATSPTI